MKAVTHQHYETKVLRIGKADLLDLLLGTHEWRFKSIEDCGTQVDPIEIVVEREVK